MKIKIITQARVGSTRLPAKVLRKVGGFNTLLELHLWRLKKSKYFESIIVATTNEYGAEKIIDVCESIGVSYYQGSTEDVLDRFYKASVNYNPDYIVRLTSDCPLIDYKLLDQIVDECLIGKFDYCSNTLIEDFPDGQDIEVIKFSALRSAWQNAKLKSEREHVTSYIIKNSNIKGGSLFSSRDISSPVDCKGIRMTVDEEEDIECIETLISELGPDSSWREFASFIIKNPDKFSNQTIRRNEGYYKSLRNDML